MCACELLAGEAPFAHVGEEQQWVAGRRRTGRSPDYDAKVSCRAIEPSRHRATCLSCVSPSLARDHGTAHVMHPPYHPTTPLPKVMAAIAKTRRTGVALPAAVETELTAVSVLAQATKLAAAAALT